MEQAATWPYFLSGALLVICLAAAAYKISRNKSQSGGGKAPTSKQRRK